MKQLGGGADVLLATSNSYKTVGGALKGLRPDGRLVLMSVSGKPIVITSKIMGNRWRIIGSM